MHFMTRSGTAQNVSEATDWPMGRTLRTTVIERPWEKNWRQRKDKREEQLFEAEWWVNTKRERYYESESKRENDETLIILVSLTAVVVNNQPASFVQSTKPHPLLLSRAPSFSHPLSHPPFRSPSISLAFINLHFHSFLQYVCIYPAFYLSPSLSLCLSL